MLDTLPLLDTLRLEDRSLANLGTSRVSQFANTWRFNCPNQEQLTCTLTDHNKSQFDAWSKVATTFLSMAEKVTQLEFNQFCSLGERYFNGEHCDKKFGFKVYRYGEHRIFEVPPTTDTLFKFYKNYKYHYGVTFDPDDKDYLLTSKADLIVGLIEEYNKLINKHSCLQDLNFRYWNCMVIDKIVQFTQQWEGGLRLQLDVEFLKQLLIHISKVMTLPYGIRCDRFTQHARSPQLKKGAKLYFAYGSNMDEDQMRIRCPNSTVAGLASLANFQFFINDRGVASIRPSLGETCHGLLWNIDDQDWESLDHYEGVKSHFYNRLTAKIQLNERTSQTVTLDDFTDCEIYVATHTSEGPPRHGYLEKIMNAANKWSNDEINHFSKKDPEDFGCVVSELDRGRNLWIKELNSWKNGD